MNHSGAIPATTPGTSTQSHPERFRSDSPASRACAEHGTGSMERGKGTGSRDRSNSPTRPASITVRAVLATLAGWITTITDRHRPCRQAVSELSALVSPGRGERLGTVHACPTGDEAITRCCGQTPLELPHTNRLTLDPELVTCFEPRYPSTVWPASHPSKETT